MRTKILIIAFLFINTIHAQHGFFEGFFILNDGSKKECLIKYQYTTSTPVSFYYKNSPGDKAQKIDFHDFKVLQIDGVAKFVKATIEMDRHTKFLNQIDMNREVILKSETHLLKAIVEGEYTLYIYEERGLTKFFYSGKDNVIKTFIYKQYYSDQTSTSILENQTYKRQLWNEVRCETTKQAEVENTDFNQRDLEKYFKKVNKCFEGDKIVKKSSDNFGFLNLKVSVASNLLTLKETSGFDFGSKVTFGLGAEFEYFFPTRNHRLSFVFEPNYLTFKNHVNQNLYGINREGSADLKMISFPVGLRYYAYKNDKYRFFGDLNRTVFTSLKFNVQHNGYSFSEALPGKNDLSIGLGMGYKKLDIQFKTYFNPFNNSSGYHLKHNSLIIRYSLFNNKERIKEK